MTIDATRYCWVIGNTGFRESALYEKIESYLIILEEFHSKGFIWAKNQRDFFDLMNMHGFMTSGSSSARNAPKAARLKTSPLEKLGLVTVDREITDVGAEVLKRANLRIKSDYVLLDKDHFLENDGDVYIRQLLKLQFHANSDLGLGVRPFVLFVEFQKEFDYLSKNEMTYILPLIISNDLIDYGKKVIISYREAKTSESFNEYSWFKNFLIEHKNRLSNIRALQNYINDNIADIKSSFQSKNRRGIENFLITIDDNGKSPKYSLKLNDLFSGMYDLWKNIHNFQLAKKAIDGIIVGVERTSGTQKAEWRRTVLGVTNKRELYTMEDADYQKYLNWFKQHIYEDEFKEFVHNVFDNLWYIKMANNLKDYEDHNTRYLKLSNILETEYINGEKTLKISDFYQPLVDRVLEDKSLYNVIFDDTKYKEYLYDNSSYQLPSLDIVDMNKIADKIIRKIESISRKQVIAEKPETLNYRQWVSQLRDILVEQKTVNLINDTRKKILFNGPDSLVNCLKLIRERKDRTLRNVMDIEEANIPTIFEYLVWKAFLVLGDYSRNPIKFANFSLDNDLKPVQHAGGGLADVIFKYKDHDLVLEATLTNEENQRRLEMEPVPRHLAKHISNSHNSAYCIFVAPNIDPNVAVVHRSFKTLPYYIKNEHGEYEAVEDMAILPLSIDDLKTIINYSVKNDLLYKELKTEIFDILISCKETDGYLWYRDIVQAELQTLE